MKLSPYHYEEEFGSCWKWLFQSPRPTVLLPVADLKWRHHDLVAAWMVQPTTMVYIELKAFYAESLRKHKNRSTFSVISHQWNGTGSSVLKIRACIFCLSNVIIADDLVTQGAMASAAMVWHFCGYGGFSSRSIQILYGAITHVFHSQSIAWLHLKFNIHLYHLNAEEEELQ